MVWREIVEEVEMRNVDRVLKVKAVERYKPTVFHNPVG